MTTTTKTMANGEKKATKQVQTKAKIKKPNNNNNSIRNQQINKSKIIGININTRVWCFPIFYLFIFAVRGLTNVIATQIRLEGTRKQKQSNETKSTERSVDRLSPAANQQDST